MTDGCKRCGHGRLEHRRDPGADPSERFAIYPCRVDHCACSDMVNASETLWRIIVAPIDETDAGEIFEISSRLASVWIEPAGGVVDHGTIRWSMKPPPRLPEDRADPVNAYLVRTRDERTYVEPILDDGTGPSFPCWPMAPVVADRPARAKALFLARFAGHSSTGVETDDWTNLRVRLLDRDVDLPEGVRETDEALWIRVGTVLAGGVDA